MNICAKCIHFRSEGPIWYDQYCGAVDVERVAVVDPVSGESTYSGKNDLGGLYYTEEKRPHARDINKDGQCPHYEEGS